VHATRAFTLLPTTIQPTGPNMASTHALGFDRISVRANSVTSMGASINLNPSVAARSFAKLPKAPRTPSVVLGWVAPSRPKALRMKVSANAAQDPKQLASARLPVGVDTNVFSNSLYQWAASLTTSGQNMPFALPQKVDRTPTGFTMAFLKSDNSNGFATVGEIEASIEPISETQNALIVTGTGPELDFLVDIPLVMQTMPGAIKAAVEVSKR